MKIYQQIKKKYSSENWQIRNFNLDVQFIDDICKCIYFAYYHDYNALIEKYGGLVVYLNYIVNDATA